MRGRILVVDDEPSILLTLAAILEREGLEVDTATCSQEAVCNLQTDAYDIVITDMHMETETAGYEVARAANAQPCPPITIILTGFSLQCTDWKEHGAHALLEKPMNAEELLLVIDTLIRERQRVATHRIA